MKSYHCLGNLIILFMLCVSLSSCQKEATTKSTPSFDEWLKTPIPQKTLWASYEIHTVENKQQAVMKARARLLLSRVHLKDNSRVVSVDFIKYEDAIIRSQATDSGQYASEEMVWLVKFEGYFIYAPLPGGNEETIYGNVFVILLQDEGIIVTWKKIEQSNPYPITTPVASLTPYSNQQAIVTPLPVDMTPVPASKEVLAKAMGNFEQFFNELPFVKTTKGEPIREYYGCIDSQNAGSIINYTVNTQSAENIKNAFVEYLDGQKIKHSDWKKFEISGFLGYSWKILASKYPENDHDALVIVYASLLEYRLRATSEPFEVPIPTEDTGIPESHLYLWLNYFETSDQIIGFEQSDLLKTCEEGWWLAINP